MRILFLTRPAVAVALSCLCATVAAADDPEFKKLYAKGLSDGKGETGIAYTERFDPPLNSHLATLGNLCVAKTPAKEPAAFKAVAVLKADGKVRKLLVSPKNVFSRCMAKELSKLTWPAPPKPNYAKIFEMRISVAKPGRDPSRR